MSDEYHALAVALQQVLGTRLRSQGMDVCTSAGWSIDRSVRTQIRITVPADKGEAIEVESRIGATASR